MRHGLEQGVITARPHRLFPAAFEVELLLDLVTAGVRNLIAELAQLGKIAAEREHGDARLLRQLERVEARLGDDRGEHPQQPSETLSPIQELDQI